MAFADPARVRAAVYAVLDRPSQAELPYQDVEAARFMAGMEVLRAIANNPKHGFYGAISTLVTVAHNAFLPEHEGEPGIPVITAFAGGPVIDGYPATPDEIESYRLAPTNNKLIYSGSVSGVAVAHNQADENNMPSPVAGRYSIVNKRLKFTGASAQVPLVQLTRTMAGASVPENYEPTLVRYICGSVGDGEVARRCAAEAVRDLALIQNGSMQVEPIPDVQIAQKVGGV